MLRPELPTMRDTSCSCNDMPNHPCVTKPWPPQDLTNMSQDSSLSCFASCCYPSPTFFTGRGTEAQWKASASPGSKPWWHYFLAL